MAKSIAVVGAGAKAAAIVARAAALKDCLTEGEVPTLHVFERDHVGAGWSGDALLSSGYLTLCTPGEKDVGFPYDETVTDESEILGPFNQPVGPLLFSRYSWPAYLVASGGFAEWIDRGRDHPQHREWAGYLEWVFQRAGVDPIIAEVSRLLPLGGKWAVSYREGTEERTIEVDAVVLTGVGKAVTVAASEDIPPDRLFDSGNFWALRDRVADLQEGTIAVAGAGGSAGAIVAWLAEHFRERDVRIASISPSGTLFPRADGFAERRWFSDPTDWPLLSLDHRRNLLKRTEAGVISLRLKRAIDQSSKIDYRPGRAIGVRWYPDVDDSAQDELLVEIAYGDQDPVSEPVRFFVSALGFDAWSCLEIVNDPNIGLLLADGADALRDEVEKKMRPDLSLPPLYGLPEGLHVPALAGLACGPGMDNLGCLGLMAKAVLDPYF